MKLTLVSKIGDIQNMDLITEFFHCMTSIKAFDISISLSLMQILRTAWHNFVKFMNTRSANRKLINGSSHKHCLERQFYLFYIFLFDKWLCNGILLFSGQNCSSLTLLV